MVRLFLALIAIGALTAGWAEAAPASPPPPIEAYGRLPAVDLITLSPSGQRIATIEVVDNQRVLAVGTADGSKTLFHTNLGNVKVRDIEWAGDDHLLILATQTTNIGYDFTVPVEELWTAISVNISTEKMFPVFAGHSEVENIISGFFGTTNEGGHWYGYFGGITYQSDKGVQILTHTWPDLYRVDLDSGDMHLTAIGKEGIVRWLVDANGSVVARELYDQHSGAWQVTAGPEGDKTIGAGQGPFGGGKPIALGRLPGTVLIEEPTDAGDQYVEAPISGGTGTSLPESDIIKSMLIDPVSHAWLGEVTEGDFPRDTMFEPHTAAKVAGALAAFPGVSTELVSWSEDFNRMIISTSGVGDSGTYWLVNIATGDADPIGYAYPDVKEGDVGPIRMVDWKAGDGLALRGVLSLPPGRDPHNLPLVVLPHGGPEDRDYPEFDWWAQAIASRGYAVFQPNFRGSSGYGSAFRDAGFGEWGRKMQTDVSDGVAELAREGVVDPKRACIVGLGYGGYAALAGVTLQHGLYRCAVAMAGISNPAASLEQAREVHNYMTNSKTRYWERYMGTKNTYDSSLDTISPLKHAGDADAPILLIHGKDDTVVPIDQSNAMLAALKAAGKPVEMVVMPAEDHWLSRDDTRVLMLQSAVAFVEKYDPPDPPPAASTSAAAVAGP